MQRFSPDPIRNPTSYEEWAETWGLLEAIMVALFTIDFLIRAVGAGITGHFKRWAGNPMNMVDFLAIAPFYIRMAAPGVIDLRFVRVIRLVRILKTVPATREMGGVIREIISGSIGALFIPIYFMCL
jgi:hypothetical protein